MKQKSKLLLHFASYKQLVSSVVNDTLNERAVFLLGAGISMIKPTELPSGKQMKEIVFESLIDLPRFTQDKEMLHKNFNYDRIIPEVLFSEIHSIIKDKIFNSFNILYNGKPNALHRLFGYLANKYNSMILTTNFDLFIDDFVTPNKKIYHLHGDLNNIENIYILLNRIGKGINTTQWSFLNKKIKNKNIYVLGYSGNDKDILEFINNSEINSIKWMVRKGEEEIVITNTKELKNIDITYYFGDLKNFYRDLLRQAPIIKESGNLVSRPSKREIRKTKEILKDYKKSINEVEVLLCLIQVHYRIGNYRRLIELGKKFLREQTNSSLAYKYTIICRIAGVMRLVPRGYFSALRLVDSALREKKAKSHYLYGELLNSKGVILHSRLDNNPKNIKIALKLFTKSLYFLREEYLKISKNDILNRETAILRLSMVYNNIGLCHYQSSDFQNAEKFFLKSLQIKRTFGNINGQISSLYNLCMLAYRTGKRSFSYWEREAIFLMKKYNVHFRRVSLLKDVGLIMIEKGLISEGKKKLTEALAITNEYIPEFVIKNELTKYIRKYSSKLYS